MPDNYPFGKSGREKFAIEKAKLARHAISGERSEVLPKDIYDYAHAFIGECGLYPTPDAVAQLAEVFVPCLKIMCERGYDPEGETWKSKGWRGLVHDILNKAGRLRYHSWLHSKYDRDSALDMINFCGFYIRLENQGESWGTWGEPGE